MMQLKNAMFLLYFIKSSGAISAIPFRFFPSAFRPGSDSGHFSLKWPPQAAQGDRRKRPTVVKLILEV
ncbi:MAG: hypothetical protein NTW95_06420, partial [Candidatus Aminicenantes bacterium]|nr:hypothetical protein [Candidatus Aminicenantes bacterium]